MRQTSISGFTMVKNATLLYYPIRQAIESILPIVDEFVVALGDCDPGDRTEEEIRSIGSDKIRLINTVWDTAAYPNGTENAHQTDIAKRACLGNWLFYLQADEVVHEKYLPVIRQRCNELADDPAVEGLLFDYVHFWGDYDHYQISHGWYKHEIRIVRNHPDIHSWGDAQSFRRIAGFDGKSYRQQHGTHKLKVAKSNAAIFHYGWVRPPDLMQRKKRTLDAMYHEAAAIAKMFKDKTPDFDYGPLDRAARFEGTHPSVMKNWIARFDWKDKLDYSCKIKIVQHKHDRLKYRLLTFVEQKLLGGRELGGFKNYELLSGK
jgi:hypothetical protein